jgi:hypothetical protein
MISQRTKAALAAAKARGVKMGNPHYQEALAKARAALGYKPPPAEVLSLMIEWRGQGDVLRRIAARLNGLNIRTSQGCIWHAASVGMALLRDAKARYAATVIPLYEDMAFECNPPSAQTSFLPEASMAVTPDIFAPTALRGAKHQEVPCKISTRLTGCWTHFRA